MRPWIRKLYVHQLLKLFSIGALATLTACINLTAPEEPIVIQLNINIQQEVVYRLDDDSKNLIEENEDIFG